MLTAPPHTHALRSSPRCAQTLDDTIKDVAFIHAERPPPPLPSATEPPPPAAHAAHAAHAAAGGLVLVAISASAILYAQPLSASDPSNGPHILTDALQVRHLAISPQTSPPLPVPPPRHLSPDVPTPRSRSHLRASSARFTVQTPPELRGRVGAQLHYSSACSLLFTVYADGRCFALRLNDAVTEVVGGFGVTSARVDPPPSSALGASKSAGAPYSHWQVRHLPVISRLA